MVKLIFEFRISNFEFRRISLVLFAFETRLIDWWLNGCDSRLKEEEEHGCEGEKETLGDRAQLHPQVQALIAAAEEEIDHDP
jgi:hypothetical protein